MTGLSDSDRISMTGLAVLIQYMCDGRRPTDYGIAVAYMRYSIGLLSLSKKVMLYSSKKPASTPGGCLRLPVYGRLSLVFLCFFILFLNCYSAIRLPSLKCQCFMVNLYKICFIPWISKSSVVNSTIFPWLTVVFQDLPCWKVEMLLENFEGYSMISFCLGVNAGDDELTVNAGLEEGRCVCERVQHRPILGRRTSENSLHPSTSDETWRQPGTFTTYY